MAQHDYDIANQSFPSFRSDLNSVLEAINTSNSGTSRPSSAVAGTIWLDTTSATTPTLKFYDGSDDISLATLDYTANTVNWLDSTVTISSLSQDLDVNGNSIISSANGNISITPDGTGKVIIDGLSYPTADGTADQVLTTDGAGNLTFADASGGGTSWQSVQTTGFTASASNAYPCNTTSAGFTVTLPATPSAGDQVQLVDYAGTFDTNALVVDPNGEDIEGGANNLQLTGEREGVILTYIDSTQGWIATSGINEGTDALEPIAYTADFLVIAGGGGGGRGSGGGGGAGGYRNSFSTETSGGNSSSETSLTFIPGTVYTITVGAGGAGSTNSTIKATDGSNSSISGTGITTITSNGGGGGGSESNNSGYPGGSGSGSDSAFGGGGSGGSGTANQGSNGGSGAADSGAKGAGGGGGASANGQDGTTSAGGNGGAGLASSITGSSVTRAGGGGGGAFSSAGSGGNGGGGAGGASGTAGTAGTANTGGGGGGGGIDSPGNGGTGGKGVIILRMPDANYSGTTTGSPTVTTGVGGTDTVIVFNDSGSYTG